MKNSFGMRKERKTRIIQSLWFRRRAKRVSKARRRDELIEMSSQDFRSPPSEESQEKGQRTSSTFEASSTPL